MSFLSTLPWGKIAELAISLITKAIKYNSDLKELEEEWLRFTKNINRKIPVKFSDDQLSAIYKLDEIERLNKVKIDAFEVKIQNYKNEIEKIEDKNKQLYSENLKLRDKELTQNLSREF